VFTSVTDTFGLALIEAMASGTPVAAFPVAGPIDVVGTSAGGVLDADLRRACLAALALPRDGARSHAMTFSWAAATRQFVDALPVIAHRAATGGLVNAPT
jgi:glycosyltransferase involved in cell wall biosynthesis